jgi:hypothetical protein
MPPKEELTAQPGSHRCPPPIQQRLQKQFAPTRNDECEFDSDPLQSLFVNNPVNTFLPVFLNVTALLSSHNWNQWGVLTNASGSEGRHVPDGCIYPISHLPQFPVVSLLKEPRKQLGFLLDLTLEK